MRLTRGNLLLGAGLGTLAVCVAASRGAASTCSMGYPFASGEPRTSVVFNESEVLRAFDPVGTVTAAPGLTIKMWYNDEHAVTLGVRQVIVKTRNGTTTTNYPVSSLAASPSSASHPAVGTTALDGEQAGTDTSTCPNAPDRCDRPMFPALFLTDVTNDAGSTVGDWQMGGTPVPPHAIFGTWKAAVRTVDETKSPAQITVTPDSDPAKNHWNLAGGDAAPAGLTDEGYGFEARWSVDDLVSAGQVIMGHSYRLQFMVHDGDQNKTGGDAGENCINVTMPQCRMAADCDDANACTTDSCQAGVCQHDAAPDCKPCTKSADCDDHDACTTDACTGGICRNGAISGCRSCSHDSDCNDGNACTTDACNAGVCANAAVAGCRSCVVAADCDDHDACTTESCVSGLCHESPVAGCRPCAVAADCDDHDACTTESCVAGACDNTRIAGCRSCRTAADCGDGNACTTDLCEAGVCANHAIAGCVPCRTAADCDDANACTTETCDAGVCGHADIAGCTPCATDADCDDKEACTADACQAGACTHSQIADCPTKKVEICGDCIDNDGDGLVDYDDPDCCEQVSTLTLKRMRLVRPDLKIRGRHLRLKLRALYAKRIPAGFDPTREDTTVQVSDARGSLVCATVTKEHWMKSGHHVGFCDKYGTFAHGLLDGRFITPKRNGKVIFRTISQQLPVRPVVGDELYLTIRVGNRCMRESVSVKPTTRALVYP